MRFHRYTERVFYLDLSARSCDAEIVKVGPDYIELDRTVAYPEGGGQESDAGAIFLESGQSIPFSAARKMYTSPSNLPGFEDVKVGGVIWHLIPSGFIPNLASIQVGMKARVEIDYARRQLLSLHHTASHLLYAAIELVRPGTANNTLGCHIKTNGARFDFNVAARFCEEELSDISAIANELINSNKAIHMASNEIEPDARTWICGEISIPCGGTHVETTGILSRMSVRRRNLGVGKERLACALTEETLPKSFSEAGL